LTVVHHTASRSAFAIFTDGIPALCRSALEQSILIGQTTQPSGVSTFDGFQNDFISPRLTLALPATGEKKLRSDAWHMGVYIDLSALSLCIGGIGLNTSGPERITTGQACFGCAEGQEGVSRVSD